MNGGSFDIVNPKLRRAQYALRGSAFDQRVQRLKDAVDKGGEGLPFKRLIMCNLGNPQALQQRPFTYCRQVLSLFVNPALLDDPIVAAKFPRDVRERVGGYVKALGHWTATGAYTQTKGYAFSRVSAARFIEERDNAASGRDLGPVDPEDIFIGNGAGSCVVNAMMLVLAGSGDGVLYPVPQFPLYSMVTTLFGGTALPYLLDESDGWSLKTDELSRCLEDALAKNCTPRVLVMINPGNPTGAVLPSDTIRGVIQFCYQHKLLLLADEVYQANVYSEHKKFVSARQLLKEMPEPIRSGTMVISLHSASKGLHGECGRRGGYMQLENFSSDAAQMLLKAAATVLCSNIDGQIMVELLTNPPRPGDESYALYKEEHDALLGALSRRANVVTESMNATPGLQCNEVEGALYAFVKLHLPELFIQHAIEQGMTRETADEQWCIELLEETGIVVVPGSGFGQSPGTYHFRLTILPPEDQIGSVCEEIKKFHTKIICNF